MLYYEIEYPFSLILQVRNVCPGFLRVLKIILDGIEIYIVIEVLLNVVRML